MNGSVGRVERAAAEAGLPIEIRRTAGPTRTAEEAAAQCGCDVAQIVKSLIFIGKSSKTLYLFLVSGRNQLDLDKAASLAGEALQRADPRDIRNRTGFAIGGVAPIGHVERLRCFADETLFEFPIIWAAAGAPDAVFSAEPRALFTAARASTANLKT